jgi:heme/copper-type cytochrome/quinol oxidase subunit 4
MAKRRKEKDDEEDKPFKLPKFDKEEFMRKERRNIKSMFIAFLFAVVMAIICFGFFVLMGPETEVRWFLVLLVAIFSASFIKYFYMRLNIDTSEFTKKNWFVTYAVYFVAWLLILTILVNPPFYDDQNPKIDLVVLPGVQEPGYPVNFCAKITDNTKLKKSDITFSIDGTVVDPSEYEYTDNLFKYVHKNNDEIKKYSYTLKVTDSSGLETVEENNFEYSNNSIYVPDPLNADKSPGPEVGSATSIKFKVSDNVDRVYYTLTDSNGITSKEINVTQKEGEYYITYPKYEGWPKDQNVTMNVYADKIHYFPMYTSNQYCEITPSNMCNNTIVDSQTYYFQVADETGISSEKAPTAKLPTPVCNPVPGFETIIFVLSLLAVLLIIRHKKKDKK